MACRKAGLRPGSSLDLARVRGVGSTGAPLPAEGFRWVYEAVGRDLVLGSLSGGTDMCTGFLGPCPLLPVVAGEITCRMLGARVEAFDEGGRSIVGRQGELVITAPMPSMPVRFWDDPDGERYRAAYFADYPGVWRHGDWITITERGTCVVTGRSDATLNRGGVRLGTAEFYTVVEGLPEVADSLVVHLEDPAGGPGELVLFVALRDGTAMDAALRGPDRLRPANEPLAASCAGRDRRGAGHPADAVGQEARGAGEADPDRHPGRRRGVARLAGGPVRARPVRGARPVGALRLALRVEAVRRRLGRHAVDDRIHSGGTADVVAQSRPAGVLDPVDEARLDPDPGERLEGLGDVADGHDPTTLEHDEDLLQFRVAVPRVGDARGRG